MIGKKKVEFAKALRTANLDDAKRITDHFNAQKDLFTQCPKCKTHLRGTLAEIKAHACSP
jgi:hypothetical protein